MLLQSHLHCIVFYLPLVPYNTITAYYRLCLVNSYKSLCTFGHMWHCCSQHLVRSRFVTLKSHVTQWAWTHNLWNQSPACSPRAMVGTGEAPWFLLRGFTMCLLFSKVTTTTKGVLHLISILLFLLLCLFWLKESLYIINLLLGNLYTISKEILMIS